MKLLLYVLSLVLAFGTVRMLLGAVGSFLRLPAGTSPEVQAESWGMFAAGAVMLFIAYKLFQKARSY